MIDIGIGVLAWWQAILAVVVGVVGAARFTRVVTYDDFPPTAWLRGTYGSDEGWGKLLTCSWCFGFWAAVLALGTFLLTFAWLWFAWVWWLGWGALALGYFVSQYVHFDEGRE